MSGDEWAQCAGCDHLHRVLDMGGCTHPKRRTMHPVLKQLIEAGKARCPYDTREEDEPNAHV